MGDAEDAGVAQDGRPLLHEFMDTAANTPAALGEACCHLLDLCGRKHVGDEVRVGVPVIVLLVDTTVQGDQVDEMGRAL